MRIYVSGKITDNENYKEDFARAVKMLDTKNTKDLIINPAALSEVLLGNARHEDYMQVCFTLLDTCDCIFLLDNLGGVQGGKSRIRLRKSQRSNYIARTGTKGRNRRMSALNKAKTMK